MRMLLPILFALAGLVGGAFGGKEILRRMHESKAETCSAVEEGTSAAEMQPQSPLPESSEDPLLNEYVKLNNQFVVPVVEDSQVSALVILSISLEVTPGSTEQIYLREPKLRNAFLQVLFDHANAGGFSGAFTQTNRLENLANALREVAEKIAGAAVVDILITDIVRQDT